jgi:predicted nucleotidyltransferase
LDLDSGEMKFYIFGSAVSNKNYSDIDILVTYQPSVLVTYPNMILLRENLKNNIEKELKQQADVVLLTIEEEKDLDYIQQVKAVNIQSPKDFNP